MSSSSAFTFITGGDDGICPMTATTRGGSGGSEGGRAGVIAVPESGGGEGKRFAA